MRNSLKALVLAHVTLAIYIIFCFSDIIGLLLHDWHTNLFTSEELNPDREGLIPTDSLLIPKIIHQTYKDTNLPEDWKKGQEACIRLNPDYKYVFWTDEKARTFIARNYPWFLSTWDGYKFPIERADAIRYFVLFHYGGVYIDLDDFCKRRLDPLLTAPAFVTESEPVGISNDVMGSVPHHPFFEKMLRSLQDHNRNLIIPYATIMFSTGPIFASTLYTKYFRSPGSKMEDIKMLLSENCNGKDNPFFKMTKGSSWHRGDAKYVKAIGRHIPLTIFSCTLFVLCILLLEWYLYCTYTCKSFCCSFQKITNKFKLRKKVLKRNLSD